MAGMLQEAPGVIVKGSSLWNFLPATIPSEWRWQAIIFRGQYRLPTAFNFEFVLPYFNSFDLYAFAS
jgi:hypothetical protein